MALAGALSDQDIASVEVYMSGGTPNSASTKVYTNKVTATVDGTNWSASIDTGNLSYYLSSDDSEANIDALGDGEVTLHVVVTDSAGNKVDYEKDFDIELTNSAPTVNTEIADLNVQTSSAAGTELYDLVSKSAFSDLDSSGTSNGTLTYSLKMADGSSVPSWLAVSSAGKLVIAEGQTAPSDATSTTLVVRVVATDGAGATAKQDVNLSVTSGWAPSSINMPNGETVVSEGDTVNIGVQYDSAMVVSLATDPSGKPTATFNINGKTVTGTWASFGTGMMTFNVIVPTSATGTSISLVSLDPRESTMTLNGRPLDTGFNAVSMSGLTVDDGDPTFNKIAHTVDENSTGVVATLDVSDYADLTYSIGSIFGHPAAGSDVAQASDLFTVNDQGQISLKAGQTIDYETYTSYKLSVKAKDEYGNETTKDVSLSIDDVNEAPTASDISDLSAFTNKAFSSSVASHFTDVDSGDSLTFSATGLPDGLSMASNGTISGTPTGAGTSTVTVTATDSGGLTVTQDVDISVSASLSLSTNAKDVTNLDVRSDLVVSGSENLSLTDQAGTYTITLTDGTTSGYEGDNTNNTQTISIVIGSDGSVSSVSTSGDNGTTSKTISDISDVLTISGSKVTINPAYDLDLGSDYTLSISDGLLVGSASGTSASLSASFSTVDPSTSGVVASTMGTDGTMTNGATWVDISRQGTVQPESVTNLDASAGEVVFVFQDSDTAAGVVDDSSGIKASAEFNVSIGNFGYDDLIYIDDIQNASGNDNLVSNGGFNGGDGTGTTPFTYNFIATAGSGSAKFALVLADDVTPFDLGAAGYVTNVETVADQIGFDNGMVISA